MEAQEITKKEILTLKFPENDVLDSDRKKTNRWLNLKAAAFKKNNLKSEQKIVFKSQSKGFLSVTSRVIVAQSKYIILSGGYVLPMRSIAHVH